MDFKERSSISNCFGDQKAIKTPKLNTIWLELIARVLNMLIGLKGNNYYSKVFKRVNYKLWNNTFWVVIKYECLCCFHFEFLAWSVKWLSCPWSGFWGVTWNSYFNLKFSWNMRTIVNNIPNTIINRFLKPCHLNFLIGIIGSTKNKDIFIENLTILDEFLNQ